MKTVFGTALMDRMRLIARLLRHVEYFVLEMLNVQVYYIGCLRIIKKQCIKIVVFLGSLDN